MVAPRKEKDPPVAVMLGGAGIADSAYKLALAVKSRIFVEEKPWARSFLRIAAFRKPLWDVLGVISDAVWES